MKGSLAELVEDATDTYALAQERLSCHFQQVAELQDSGVSAHRIDSLYPFDVDDYAQGISKAFANLRLNATPPLLLTLATFSLEKVYVHLPSPMVDLAHQHFDEEDLVGSKLRVLLHLSHSMAIYDSSAEVVTGETETEAENSWSDALSEMAPALDLLRSICYAAR